MDMVDATHTELMCVLRLMEPMLPGNRPTEYTGRVEPRREAKTRQKETESVEKKPTVKDVCGSIHKVKYRDFWMKLTENDNFVRQTIIKGYKPQCVQELELYQEANNKSAQENEQFVTKAVEEMLGGVGVSKVTREDVRNASPL